MPSRQTMLLRSMIVAAAMFMASAATAQTQREGYSRSGEAKVVRDGFGGCVRSGLWAQDRPVPECGVAQASAPLAKAKAAPKSMVPPPPPPPPDEQKAAQEAPAPAEPAQVKPLADSAPLERTPVTVATPPKTAPVSEITTFGLETLFDLNKAFIKPRAKAELDDLAVRIRSMPARSIEASGHSDRSGPVRFNQRLSEKRALAVRKYLVMKGVPAASIVAVGKGTSRPVTTPGECNGLFRRELAACLQPDRRVEIMLAPRNPSARSAGDQRIVSK